MGESPFFDPSLAAGAGGLYLTGEDSLRLTTWGALGGAIVTLEGRFLDSAGRSIPFVESDTASSTRVARTKIFNGREGILTNCQLRVTTGAAIRGHIFAVLEVIRGELGAVQPLGTLLSDYVVTQGRLAWPGAPIRSSVDGPGRVIALNTNAPGAGAEHLITVPTGARWRFHSAAFSFTASGAVANRRPVLTIVAGGATAWETSSAIDVTAGQAASYRAGMGTPFVTFGTRAYHLTLPTELKLPAGSTIGTVTAGLDVADQYGNFTQLYEEWIEP